MSEVRIKGIVISSIDYKEKDKLVTIYSLEKGLVSAKLIGIKNPKAKLKPLKEVFCFADFDLASSKSNDYFVITSAEIIESFYNIISDLDKYYAGCSILETLRIVGKTGESNEPLFIETLRALKTLSYENVDVEIILIKYLVKIFEAMGYQLSLNKCSSCGQEFIGKRFFDYTAGEITCIGCKGPNAELIEPLTHSILRIISTTDYEKLKNLRFKKQGIEDSLNLLIKNFSRRFDYILSFSNKLLQ
ncbi:MAG: DNA repair protein RecO [Clostridia bacterium]|nr:DNA repair protein RecO [Clostridia bacterium]